MVHTERYNVLIVSSCTANRPIVWYCTIIVQNCTIHFHPFDLGFIYATNHIAEWRCLTFPLDTTLACSAAFCVCVRGWRHHQEVFWFKEGAVERVCHVSITRASAPIRAEPHCLPAPSIWAWYWFSRYPIMAWMNARGKHTASASRARHDRTEFKFRSIDCRVGFRVGILSSSTLRRSFFLSSFVYSCTSFKENFITIVTYFFLLHVLGIAQWMEGECVHIFCTKI